MAQEAIAIVDEPAGQPQPWKAVYSGIEYPGEIISAQRWDPSWGEQLEGDLFFRIVFLASAPRRPSLTLEDPRIAVCLPRGSLDRERASGARELRSIRETRARYVTRTGPEVAPVRAALDEQERTLRTQIMAEAARHFENGRVLLLGGRTLDPATIAPGLPFDDWITALALRLLTEAYPHPLLPGQRLPAPVTEAVVAALTDGLFNTDPTPDGRAAVEWYGPPLGLSLPAFEGCALVGTVGQLLEGAGGAIEAERLFARLSHDFGVPRSLGALGVLGLLSRNLPPVEATLRPGHALLTRDGRAFSGDRLTWDLLGEVSVAPNIATSLDDLRHAQPATWLAAAPYVREVLPGLDAGELDEDERRARFFGVLRGIQEDVRSRRSALLTLTRALGQPLPAELERDLALLEGVAGAETLGSFRDACAQTLASPSRLRQLVERFRRIAPLADEVGEVIALKAYLEAMPLQGTAGELGTIRAALLAQFNISEWTRSPSALAGLQAQARQFLSHYAALYRYHYPQYHRQVATLGERLLHARPRAEALEKLNRLSALGPPTAQGLPATLQLLEARIMPCAVSTEALSLEKRSVCQECQLTLEDTPPAAATEQMLAELHQALEERITQLSARVIAQVLDERGVDSIDRFLRVARAADLDALPGVLDDGVMAFLSSLLESP